MPMIPALLLQFQDSGDTAAAAGALAGLGVMMLIFAAIMVVMIVAFWKVFTKAGQPGWAAIIPIYNGYVLLKIAGRPGWWLLLFFIPVVNLVISLLVAIDVAKAFGQGAAFGVVLLWLFSVIGYLMLGFGNYRYQGPATMIATA
jgi:Family of unknown function (DUF5684)